ncbi:hypothetical protein ACIQBJ_00120 [Kitasatospora sp. NPDC088391]|uniref:hypothetical protein n=1 Tax=Kitasatospora sp. NPDC088391 TaxID=3364074 RepID=UPI00381F6C98
MNAPGGGPVRPRLRPGVAVTPLRDGLHLRGRGAAVTLEGSRALPRLWQLLAERLGETPPVAAAGLDPAVERALATVTARLREHDLLVDHPDHAQLPPWPGAVAADPQAAVRALAAARPVLAAADPADPLARALATALTAAGTAPARTSADPALPPGLVIATAGGTAVAAGRHPGGGFATAPTDPERVREQAAALAARLRADGEGAPDEGAPDEGVSGEGESGATGSRPGFDGEVLAAMLGAAAGQRLVCAVAGLPDPGETVDDPRLPVGRPAVLVVRERPFGAAYHPWAAGPGKPAAAPADLGQALHRVAALGDERLGVLDAPSAGGLPQLPVALVSCATPAGTLLAGAPRTDLARLEAACRAAELGLAAEGTAAGAVVGADPAHAYGRALRRSARPAPREPARPPRAEHLDHPQTAHWLAALTRSLGRAPELTISRLVGTDVWWAEAEGARAIEATPAAALAFAALAALARRTAETHGPAPAHRTAPGGALAPLAATGLRPAAWADAGHTDRWLVELAEREGALQDDLRKLAGPWTESEAAPGSPTAAALAGCGFTVLVPGVPGGAR